MSDHYFTNEPSAKHAPREFEAKLRGKSYTFQTDAGVFSKGEIDLGSRILIDTLPCQAGETILDLGCGYGPIGMVASTLVGTSGEVHMVDVNERAVALARENLAKNGIENAKVMVSDGLNGLPPDLTFDWVLSNPPIRAGKLVIYQLLTDAYHRLKPSGCLLVVIRTKQGAKSLESYLTELAGECVTIEKKAGFRVLKCCKHLHT